MNRVFVLLGLLVPAVALGQDYFIAIDGDDVAGHGTIISPWRTPEKAYMSVACGDTVWIKKGVYDNGNGGDTAKNRFIYGNYPALAEASNGHGCSANNPLTIRGWDGVHLAVPKPEDRPVLYGAEVMGNQDGGPLGWSGPDANGVYHIAMAPGFPNPRTVAIELDGDSDRQLVRRFLNVRDLSPGEFNYIINSSGGFLYYRPIDDNFDSEKVMVGLQEVLFDAQGRDAVRILDLKLAGVVNQRSQGLVSLVATSLDNSVEHWELRRVSVKYAAFIGILLEGASHNVIADGWISNTGYSGVFIRAGIFAPEECTVEWRAVNGSPPPDILPLCEPVSNYNQISNMKITEVSLNDGAGDGCALCVGGGGANSHNQFIGNDIFSTGNNISLHQDAAISTWHGENSVIRENIIRNHNGTGIQVATESHGSIVENNYVYHNGFTSDGSETGNYDPRGGIEGKFSDDLVMRCNVVYGNRTGGSLNFAPRGGIGIGQPTPNSTNPQPNLTIEHNTVWGNVSGGAEPIDDAQFVLDGWTAEYVGASIDYNFFSASERIMFDGRNITEAGGTPIDSMYDTWEAYSRATGYDLNGGENSLTSIAETCFESGARDTDSDQVPDYFEARFGTSPVSADPNNDGDFYPAVYDCDDNDDGIFPGAPEIKYDGVDQDCNGYDLSIKVLKAKYSARRDTLRVYATSELGESAALNVEGYGPMRWSRRGVWKLKIRNVGGDPGSVTISGIEGMVTSEIL